MKLDMAFWSESCYLLILSVEKLEMLVMTFCDFLLQAGVVSIYLLTLIPTVVLS